MKINAKTVKKPIKKECPFCRKPCITHESEYTVTFDCNRCKTFRIARTALPRLVSLKKDHRRVFTMISRNKFLESEILEVSLASDNSFCFSSNLLEKHSVIANELRVPA